MPDNVNDPSTMATSATSWPQCIAAARDGDREALSEIFNGLRTYLCRRAKTELDCQLQVKISPSDIVQETLLEAYRSIATFQGGSRGELLAWVQGILTHRLQTAQRMYRGAGKRSIGRERPLHRWDGSNPMALVAADKSSPSQHAAANEEQERLEAALLSLPPRQEQAIRLRNELKLSFIEVGEALACTPDAAQKLWSRAISHLARKLKAHAPHREQ